MKVRAIAVQNFMAHGEARLDLPERGIVVLTGPNGAGKSRMIEAVAYAHWGKLLRAEDGRPGKATPWRRGEAGKVTVWTEHGVVTASATARGARSWSLDSERPDTPTKALDRLGALVGPFDLWRYAHVLSDADMAAFSSAKDSVRQAMVVELLGLGAFDVADGRAAVEETRCRLLAEAACSARDRAAYATCAAERAYLQVSAPPAPETEAAPAEVPPGLLARQRAELAAARAELAAAGAAAELATKLTRETGARAAAAGERYSFTTKLADMAEAGCCWTCGRSITPQEVVVMRRARDEEAEHYLALQREAAEALETGSTATRLLPKHGAVVEALASAVAVLEARTAQREGWEARQAARRARWAAEVEATEAVRRARGRELDALEAAWEVACEAQQARELELREARAARQLVGVLRSVVLGRALAGAEAVANAWLRRLAGDRPVELRLGADDKGKVLFHVHGFGGEDGYRTASTGERRLIDAPTLLALAELSGGARGATGGTLFLDEAFDALDAERRTAFAAVLRVVAEQRCVVVATHAPEREALCPVAKYAVEAGALRRI